MIKWNSYYFLILFIPALYSFYTVVTWRDCIPVSEIDAYRHIMVEEKVPVGSTCFSAYRMKKIVFHSYLPLKDNLFYYRALYVIIFVCLVLLVLPVFRLLTSIKIFSVGYQGK